MQKQNQKHNNILTFTLLRSINLLFNFNCQLLQLKSAVPTV